MCYDPLERSHAGRSCRTHNDCTHANVAWPLLASRIIVRLGYGLTPLKNLLLRVEGLCNLADVYKECVIMAVFPCVCGNER